MGITYFGTANSIDGIQCQVYFRDYKATRLLLVLCFMGYHMFRRLAVNKYYREMMAYLLSRYGMSNSYTVGQIEKTVEQCGFSKKYLPYALALYMEKTKFEELLESRYLEFNSNELRGYLADRFFDGNMNFEYKSGAKSSVGNSGHTSVSHSSASSVLRR